MPTLEYSTLTPGLEQWPLGRLVRAMPCWLIAVLLLIPVTVLRYAAVADSLSQFAPAIIHSASFLFFVALFIPGSLKRGNRRHILLAVVGAAICFVIDIFCVDRSLAPRRPLPAFLIAASPIFAVAIVEWSLSAHRQAKSLAWVVGMSIAAGCVIVLLIVPLDFTRYSVSVNWPGDGFERTTCERLLRWPLQIMLTWSIVVPGLKMAHANLVKRFAAVMFLMAAPAAFYFVFSTFIYSEAQRSLAGHGAYTSGASMTILTWRGNESDKKAIWDAITEWAKPSNAFDLRIQHFTNVGEGIRILEKLDRRFCAERLSSALTARRSFELTLWGADVLGREHRYETIPLLTRYALMHPSGFHPGDVGLNAMDAWPEAASIFGIIAEENAKTIFEVEPPILAHQRARLIDLLGVDAGPNLRDWPAAFHAAGPRHLPQLTLAQAAETFRVEKAMLKYWIAFDRHHAATCQLFFLRLRKDGHAAEASKLINAKVGQLPQPFQDYWTDAHNAMNTSGPHIYECGIDDLEREIDAYCQRVEAEIAKHGLATTQPATTQSSN